MVCYSSLSHDVESSHQLSLELEGLRNVNESLVVDIDFVPSFVESFVEVTLGILFGEVVPLFDDIHGGLKGILLSKNIIPIWLSPLISALLGVLCKDAAHVVLILR